ncbi:hypothetical protein PCS_01363 [Desulfocurvibacter africanus PCS]|uniref:Uncharacterized protein n=1 Tax=Desulfocurvibacter africanus PCS TaxID=1262666 RepID=M5PV76_DESAF|nr:hypothetical protein PCS_01363 [Desulfocurvibacter africanus PCS]
MADSSKLQACVMPTTMLDKTAYALAVHAFAHLGGYPCLC